MVFSSFLFLYLFLPCTALAYYLVPRKAKNSVLLLASVLFYGWGAPGLLLPLLASCSIDYLLSTGLAPGSTADRNRRRRLSIAVSLNLGLLLYFKYANFFVEQVNSLLRLNEVQPVPWIAVALPIGISFFTFQKISYLVDVYRGATPVASSVFSYTLYVILFPQLIAGPIVRYLDVAKEITARYESLPLFLAGVCRFSLGLAKKVLIADAMGTVADNVFGFPENTLTTGWAWIGIIAYAYQIYFDFSGYSDMAIGLGWIFGFHFKENFNRPYLSQSITEFWRRWHISLTTFMREYLYIPLGGNRGTTFQTYRNLLLVFLLSGFWHGAAWNFIFWGIFHGTFLIVDRVGWLAISKKLPRVINMLLTFTIVLFGWVLFRADTLPEALRYMSVLLGIGGEQQPLLIPRGLIIDNRSIVIFFLASIFAFAPQIKSESIALHPSLSFPRTITYGASIVASLILTSMFLAARGHTPFLYFKF